MTGIFDRSAAARAFTLAEMLAALVISSMVLVAMLSVYSRAEKSATKVSRELETSELPGEILQRIAEDIDTINGSAPTTTIGIEGAKLDNGFQTSRLVIRKTIFDNLNREQIFEEIVWQACYDIDVNSLTLYRSHSGMTMEDRLLDSRRQELEKIYPFVPICTGLSLFKLQVPFDEILRDGWNSQTLPTGIRVTLSFAEPTRSVRGIIEVPDSEKIIRTIAVNRTRKIGLKLTTDADQGKFLR